MNVHFNKLFSFFQFPYWCYYCGNQIIDEKPSIQGLCSKCLFELPWWHEKSCCFCGKTHDHDYCLEKDIWNIDSFNSVFEYSSPISNWLISFKYSKNFFAGRLLAHTIQLWFRSKKKYLSHFDVIVPVSSHPFSFYLRGLNQTYFLLKKSKPIIPIDYTSCVKKKMTKKQASLFGEERLDILNQKIFKLDEKRLQNKNILIFDDVCTSGATINNLAQELKNLNCSVSALVLSRKF